MPPGSSLTLAQWDGDARVGFIANCNDATPGATTETAGECLAAYRVGEVARFPARGPPPPPALLAGTSGHRHSEGAGGRAGEGAGGSGRQVGRRPIGPAAWSPPLPLLTNPQADQGPHCCHCGGTVDLSPSPLPQGPEDLCPSDRRR